MTWRCVCGEEGAGRGGNCTSECGERIRGVGAGCVYLCSRGLPGSYGWAVSILRASGEAAGVEEMREGPRGGAQGARGGRRGGVSTGSQSFRGSARRKEGRVCAGSAAVHGSQGREGTRSPRCVPAGCAGAGQGHACECERVCAPAVRARAIPTGVLGEAPSGDPTSRASLPAACLRLRRLAFPLTHTHSSSEKKGEDRRKKGKKMKEKKRRWED